MSVIITLLGPPAMVGLLGLIVRWELAERRHGQALRRKEEQ